MNFDYDEYANVQVQSSYYMSYQTTTVTSLDFYSALRQVRVVADDIKKMLSEKGYEDIVFFPYSVFYVYYEQYLTIWTDSLFSLGISLLAVFAVTFVLTGDYFISASKPTFTGQYFFYRF